MLFKVTGAGSLAERVQARIDELLERQKGEQECPYCPEMVTTENGSMASCMSVLIHHDCHSRNCEDPTECFADGEPPELD